MNHGSGIRSPFCRKQIIIKRQLPLKRSVVSPKSEENIIQHNEARERCIKFHKNEDFVSDVSDEEKYTLLPLPKLKRVNNVSPADNIYLVENDNETSNLIYSDLNMDETDTHLSLNIDDNTLLMPPPSVSHVLKKSGTQWSNLTRSEVMLETYISQIMTNNNKVIENISQNTKKIITEVIVQTNTDIISETTCCCVHTKKILENVIAVRTLVNEQLKTLEHKYGQDLVDHVKNFDTVPEEPFERYRKLMKYEDLLRNSTEAKKQQETVFYIGGGGNENDCIKRGLRRIFHNKLAKKCSWTGRKQNFPLRNLILMSILKDAVRKRFIGMTDKSFETHVALWFRQAPLRYIRGMKEN